jgi:SAM-dependent methyltransferase
MSRSRQSRINVTSGDESLLPTKTKKELQNSEPLLAKILTYENTESTDLQLTRSQTISTQDPYDPYYRRGAYDKRFNPQRVNYKAERALIKNTLKKSLAAFSKFKSKMSHPEKLCILDYGCGSGRASGPMLEIAKQLPEGVKLEITGIDPSPEGLIKYKEKLTKQGFEVMEDFDVNQDPTSGKAKLSKDNIEVNLFIGNETKITDFESGYFNASFSIFGVLSALPDKAAEIEALKIINEATCGPIAITVAGLNIFPEAQRAYKYLRGVEPELKTRDPQHIKYLNAAGDVLEYRPLSTEETQEIVEKAGITIEKIGVSSFYHPTTLSKNKPLDMVDYRASRVMNKIFPNSNKACYVECIGKSSKLVALAEQESAKTPSSTTRSRTIKPIEIELAVMNRPSTKHHVV